jgi:hypothetical protein
MRPVFSKPREYYDFRRSVITGYEHIFDDDAQAFLNAVAASLQARFVRFEKDSRVFRARRGCEWKPYSEDTFEAVAYPADGMKPLSKTPGGRANSPCKPVFYCATDDKTAVAETRPWVGALLSVASFCVVKELKLVNCADCCEMPKFSVLLKGSRGDATQGEINEAVWNDIGRAFAEPVTLDDDPIAYLPTQIFAELFRRHGADGIAYRSAVGGGFNMAIFDLGAVTLESSRVVEVSKLDIQIEEGPFF